MNKLDEKVKCWNCYLSYYLGQCDKKETKQATVYYCPNCKADIKLIKK